MPNRVRELRTERAREDVRKKQNVPNRVRELRTERARVRLESRTCRTVISSSLSEKMLRRRTDELEVFERCRYVGQTLHPHSSGARQRTVACRHSRASSGERSIKREKKRSVITKIMKGKKKSFALSFECDTPHLEVCHRLRCFRGQSFVKPSAVGGVSRQGEVVLSFGGDREGERSIEAPCSRKRFCRGSGRKDSSAEILRSAKVSAYVGFETEKRGKREKCTMAGSHGKVEGGVTGKVWRRGCCVGKRYGHRRSELL